MEGRPAGRRQDRARRDSALAHHPERRIADDDHVDLARIAFRFDRALAPRERPYDYDEVAAAVTAFPAIEIVDSRFRDYRGTPLIERIADCVSNGAFVVGDAKSGWREFDLSKLDARLEIDGGSADIPRMTRCCPPSSWSTICVTAAACKPAS